MSRGVREERLRVEKALNALWIGRDSMVGSLCGVALLERLEVLELAQELHAEEYRGARQARNLQRVLDARDNVPNARRVHDDGRLHHHAWSRNVEGRGVCIV